MFLLNIDEPEKLAAYLHDKGWLKPDENIVSLIKPGEGNMNYVLRVHTGERTFIIKQSRSYVEKYPQIPAPASRIQTEGAFYSRVQKILQLASSMPAFLGLDPVNNILVLEDLGDSRDFTFLYEKGQLLQVDELDALAVYLEALHNGFIQEGGDADFANVQMRKLNHEHIFYYPFIEENGFNLDIITPGLQQYAMKFKQDSSLKGHIGDAGKIYMDEGDFLLHGDFYPGSWLQTAKDVKVIDPEFTFYGPKEFDLGVFKAHLILSEHEANAWSHIEQIYPGYECLDVPLLNTFAGIEIMRRLIGLAQLPLFMEISKKVELLERAYYMIK
jgi:5-methylthioribose kinase